MAKKTNTNKVAHITLKLNVKQLDSLERVLEYMEDSEKTHYEEHIFDGGVPEDHIYHHVKMIQLMKRKQIKNIG